MNEFQISKRQSGLSWKLSKHFLKCVSMYGLARHHHNSYSPIGLYYVRSWVSSFKHVSGLFFTEYRHYSNKIYVYTATSWPNPKMGPPHVQS